MKRTIILLQINCFLLGISNHSFSQQNNNYYSSTAEEKVYTDLRIAVYEKDNVFRLDLSNQELKRFPEQIYELYNLQVLILDENQISDINLVPDKLNNLSYLSLKNNKLIEFGIPQKCLYGLKELYLDFNQLIEFPEINNEDIELNTLSLTNNYIAHLPIEDLSLSRLVHFNLDSNPLKNAEIAFSYSPILERLSMYQTNLVTLPENITYNRLVKLVISDNPVVFNSNMSKVFPNLEYLDVSYTNLYSSDSFLPLCMMKSIKYLSVDDCKIKSLPPEIAHLKKLREVSLIRNNLSTFPTEFYSMKLKLINLEENPISFEEKERLGKAFEKAAIHF